MPTTYYLAPPSTDHHRSRSHSRSHSGHYEQPVVYAPSSTHRSSSRHNHSHSYGGHPTAYASSSPGHSNTEYYDGGNSGRRRHHSISAGHGGAYYPSNAPVYTAPSTHRHRSQSRSRHHSPQVIDLRQRTYGDGSRHHRHSHSADPTVGERLRSFFSIGPHSPYTSRRTEYVDARSGRPVDRQGNPMYKY
ncbi:hypothetical protein BKA93DRAFT_772205 [Sparassis latifolia]